MENSNTCKIEYNYTIAQPVIEEGMTILDLTQSVTKTKPALSLKCRRTTAQTFAGQERPCQRLLFR